jgi:GT2 family glycosyltransferase
MKSTPLLSIIIVSYNTVQLTLQTLDSVFSSVEKSILLKNKVEIIVIDNASSDESVSKIKKLTTKHKNLQLIENKDNVGFARANNQAAKLARGEQILLLNSDTIVINDALEKLVQTATKNNLGIAVAQLLNPDKTIQPQGGSFPNLLSILNHFFFLDDLPLIGRLIPSTQHTGLNTRQSSPDWVGGTAMLVSKKVWDKLNGLDGKIFMYGEDMEFCLRAHHQSIKIGLINNAQITHLGSASSSNKNAIHGEIKGYLYIWKKHYPAWQLPILKLILRIGIVLRVLLFGMILRDKNKGEIYRTALNIV